METRSNNPRDNKVNQDGQGQQNTSAGEEIVRNDDPKAFDDDYESAADDEIILDEGRSEDK
jgi:hypothetical protein